MGKNLGAEKRDRRKTAKRAELVPDMMDIYKCAAEHRFMRASGEHEEFIPCAFCELLARFVETVDENSFKNNGHDLLVVEVEG